MNAVSTHLIGHKMNIKNILRETLHAPTRRKKKPQQQQQQPSTARKKIRGATAARLNAKDFSWAIINLLRVSWNPL